MTSLPEPHRTAFQKARSCQSHPCSYGTLAVPPESLILFYGKDGPARRLDFTDASEDDLKHLAETCDAATFGRNEEDVLDETYRKAGKLDKAHFAINFDPGAGSSGLMNSIRDTLLEGHDEGTDILHELYKLNVYGPGSFFKSHKDTPRGDGMFASLVVILPTPHEGGELRFHQHSEEFKFDSANALTQSATPSIAFAAFFSDVDHEVDLVRSGYRATITWNLYFKKASPRQDVAITTAFETSLQEALRNLLADPTYLPKGGFLGFGLRHEYPIDMSHRSYSRTFTPIAHLLELLKGSDAVLYKVCKNLSLRATLRMLYKENDDHDDGDNSSGADTNSDVDVVDEGAIEVLCPGYAYLGDGASDTAVCWELREGGGLLLTSYRDSWAGAIKADIQVQWITPKRPSHLKNIRTPYINYGNEPVLSMVYGSLVLIVEIGPADDRSGKRPGKTKTSQRKKKRVGH